MFAMLFASMIVVGLIGLAVVTIGVGPQIEIQRVGEPPASSTAFTLHPILPSVPVERIKEAEPEPPAERPIEEVLLESGEDPGAVYYTSRIREAIREGNPSFGREALRQMMEIHPKSVLIEEAEALFEKMRSGI